MAKISNTLSYPNQSPIEAEDYLIGTAANSTPIERQTKTFTLGGIAEFVIDEAFDGCSYRLPIFTADTAGQESFKLVNSLFYQDTATVTSTDPCESPAGSIVYLDNGSGVGSLNVAENVTIGKQTFANGLVNVNGGIYFASEVYDANNNVGTGEQVLVSQTDGTVEWQNYQGSGLEFQGAWDADLNSPDLFSVPLVPANTGKYWIVSVAGSVPLNTQGGGVITDWEVGDWAIISEDLNDNIFWDKIDNSSVLTGQGTPGNLAIWVTDNELGDAPVKLGLGTNSLIFNSALSSDGDYANSFGADTIASGDFSTAMGKQTTASGIHSTAMGRNSIASGITSTAIGFANTASGDNSVALGNINVSSGIASFSVGFNNQSTGQSSTAMGNDTEARGNFSTAMGNDTEASGTASTAMGNDTEASGNNSTAMGNETEASGNNSTAMGSATEASGDFSVTMGKETEASGSYSTAMGQNSEASGNRSLAIGETTEANGDNSFAAGSQTRAGGSNSFAGGDGSNSDGKSSFSFGGQTQSDGDFSVAMGLSNNADGEASVAMGKVTNASGDFSTSMGSGTDASGDYSTAIGQNTVASGLTSTAIGNDTTASGDFSTAMGDGTEASGTGSTAMGQSSEASGAVSTAMGYETTASGTYSTAMGENTIASGAVSTAMGGNTTASGDFSVAAGKSNQASGDVSVAIGDANVASGFYAQAYGKDAEASGDNSFAFGTLSTTTASGTGSFSFGDANESKTTGSFTMGALNIVDGDSSFAIGKGNGIYSTAGLAFSIGKGNQNAGEESFSIGTSLNATDYRQIVIGSNNVPLPGSVNTWSAIDNLVTIGNGVDGANQSNALEIKKGGQYRLPTYGSGNVLGNDVYNLSVDSVGNVIETERVENKYIINGIVNNLGSQAGGLDFMEWTSAVTPGTTQIPLWRVPLNLKLEAVTWVWMGDSTVSVPVGNDIKFSIGKVTNNTNAQFSNYTPISDIFVIDNSDDGTYVSGQVDLSASSITVGQFENIAVVGDETGALTPNNGELAISFVFKEIQSTPTPPPPGPGETTVCDYIWTDENSTITDTTSAGTIPIATDAAQFYAQHNAGLPVAMYWNFDSNNSGRGLLYNQFAARVIQPPTGFRLPTSLEWNTIANDPCNPSVPNQNRYGANPGTWTGLTDTTELGDADFNLNGYGTATLATNQVFFISDTTAEFVWTSTISTIGDLGNISKSFSISSQDNFLIISTDNTNSSSKAGYIRFVKDV